MIDLFAKFATRAVTQEATAHLARGEAIGDHNAQNSKETYSKSNEQAFSSSTYLF